MRLFSLKLPIREIYWNRKVLTALSLFLTVVCSYSLGNALPIDNFNIPSETKCKGERTCKRNLSNASSLGGFLGLEIQNPAEGKGIAILEIKTGPSKGRVVWGAAGCPAGRLTLFWDGDPNPSQVSGAGLGCLNLLADGATAFILEDLAYSATCSKSPSAEIADTGKDSVSALCPPLVIETKIFDAMDPTGQRYSTSIIRRHYRMSGKDLRIPFSSFTQEGPNGGGHPTCVGAISVTIRADDLTKSVVTFGPMYTNGACQTGNCLLPPPFMPEGSSPGAPTILLTVTPTVTSIGIPTTVGDESGGPSATPSAAGATRTPTGAVTTPAPTVIPTVQQSAAPKVTPAPTAIESTLKIAITEQRKEKEAVSTASEMVPKEVPSKELPPVTEEFIFGEVVEHKAALPTLSPTIAAPLQESSTPTQVPQSTRRPVPTLDPLDLIP